jgi:hypothetical protein
MEPRRLADGSTAYYYCPPKKALRAGIVISEALGKDPIKAATRAEHLNQRIDDWRNGLEVRATGNRGTIDWLIGEYEKSDRYLRLGKATRADYHNRLRIFANLTTKGGKRLGSIMADQFKARHADQLYLRLQEIGGDGIPTKLSGANGIIRVVRRIFYLAIRWEVPGVSVNPFAKMELVSAPSREVVIPPEHLDVFCAQAIALGRRSMALAATLQYEMTQRPIDVRLLPWARYKASEVQVRQTKTKKLVWVPLLPDLAHLKAMLDETPQVSTQIVINEKTGKPYTGPEYSHAFREIADSAGLPPEYQAADFRRSGMDEGGDAGATEDELRSLSGHASREVVSVYVKPNRTKAASVLRKRRQYRAQRRKHLESGS